MSFAGGFLLANAINRSELNDLKAENSRLKVANSNGGDSQESVLSAEEIGSKIAEADANPANFQFQKDLGLALYKYASMKQDPALIKEAARLLDRANKLQSGDHDVVLGLANANFDIGYFEKNDNALANAREFYEQSLKQSPNDAEVRTDMALTYLFSEPPDNAKSVSLLKDSLKYDPRLEKTYEFLIQALIRENNLPEASDYLARLKKLNPQNTAAAALSSRISGTEPASQK